MDIIFSLFFLTFIYATTIFSGILLQKYIGNKNGFSFSRILLYGFIVILVVYQFIYTFFYLFDLSTNLLMIIVILLTIVAIVFGIKIVYKENLIAKWKKKYIKTNNILLLSITIIFLQILAVVVFCHKDIDDTYYVAISSTIKNSKTIREFHPLTGTRSISDFFLSEFNLSYINGWESMIGIFSKIFNVNSAFFSHSILPIFLIPLSYFSFYNLGHQFFKDKNKSALFLFFITLVHSFGYFTAYSSSAFLFFRIWQGKAVIANVLIPFIFSVFLEIYSGDNKATNGKTKNNKLLMKNDLLVFGLICYAGVNLSSIGVYYMPLGLVILVLVYCLNKKTIIPLFQSILCVLPNLIYAIIKLSGGVDGINEEIETYTTFFKKNYGEKLTIFIIIYLIFLIILFINKKNPDDNKNARIIFFEFFIILNFILINPFLYKYVARFITGTPVYWRILWYIPIQIFIAYTLTSLHEILSKKLSKHIFIAISVLLIVLSGNFIFSKSNFQLSENKYKLTNDTIFLADYLIKKTEETPSTVLLPFTISTEMRQYESNIIVANPRYTSRLHEDLKELVVFTYDNSHEDINIDLVEVLTKYNINYVILEKKADKNIIDKYKKIAQNVDTLNEFYLFNLSK